MGKRCSKEGRYWLGGSLVSLLLVSIILSTILPSPLSFVYAQTSPSVGTIAPSTNALLFGSSGNVEIDIPKPGIAVRIEIPREFLQGVVSGENDTHFITSNIRNDYYYYNVVDESAHWTYGWRGNSSSDGPCFKPNFSFYDPNAPYCVEIWNYLNYPGFKQPVPNIDYCADNNQDRYVFNCFTAPKFVLFHDLTSPGLAGLYNFTLSIANKTNLLGYPDFVNAYNLNLPVPVSMAYNAGFIAGNICDAGSGCGRIRSKGIVYAASATTNQIVARAYVNVNQTLCSLGTCGRFNLTGLAPGDYRVEGSAGVDNGYAYSLTSLGYPILQTIHVSPNSGVSIALPLRRAPLVCGLINYENTNEALIRSLGTDAINGNGYLQAAGFGHGLQMVNGKNSFRLNVTVEGTDAAGHVFRYINNSTDTSTDSFNLTTGVGVKYVGTDPYGTEFAGLPAPEDVVGGRYSLNVKVWVSGYLQVTPLGSPEIATAQVFLSPGSAVPTCPNPVGTTFSPNPAIMLMGGIIAGTLQFCNTPQPTPTCNPESPQEAENSLPIPSTGKLFGGNIMIQAYDAAGILRGVTIINGTLPDGKTSYPNSICTSFDTQFPFACNSIRFYITGFSEYYNHSLSGIWDEHDYGLPVGMYTLQVYVRGYELTSTSPTSITPCQSPLPAASCNSVTVDMIRGGAFLVLVGSFDNRFGTRAVQARLPWRFLNSSIPVRARVYFYASNGVTVGWVEAIMVTNVPNLIGVIPGSFTENSFKVVFAGQNWSLREIWFYGDVPTHVTNDTYTIKAYTLGYVRQFPNGISVANQLVGFGQGFITLFIANEVDVTVPIFNNPQTLTKTAEYDHAIGQVFSGPLFGAEMANLTAGIPTLQFNIFGFGAMQLSNATECTTDVLLVGSLNVCGQGHFFYVAPDGTQSFDYGLDVGNYTAALPEFGFLTHFLQVLTLPGIQFTDLLLQRGVFLQAIQMASIMQGPFTVVAGFCGLPSCVGIQLSGVAPLSWAQVQASNSTYSQSVPTFDGLYDGVGALFLPAGTYNMTFSDVQYQSQTFPNFFVGWGGSYSLTPPQPPLCPTVGPCS